MDGARGRARKVGKREKRVEGSAWTLCSGLPSRRDNNRTTNGHEWTRISSIHEAVTLFLYIFVFSCVSCFKRFLLLVCIRVHSWFKCFIYSCAFVVQMFYLLVSIRGSNILLFSCVSCFSWFKMISIFCVHKEDYSLCAHYSYLIVYTCETK